MDINEENKKIRSQYLKELKQEKGDQRRSQARERQRNSRKRKYEEALTEELEQQKAEENRQKNAKRQQKYRKSNKNGSKLTENKNSYRRKKKNYNENTTIDGVAGHYLGKMHILCSHCSAKHFVGERVNNKKYSFNDCCSHGSVSPTLFSDYPKKLRQLFDIRNAKSNRFFQNIRTYNCALSFASFNANLKNFENRRAGPYCFIVQGQIYYQINTSLYPKPDELPSYGQLFMIDSDEANNHRMSSMSDLNRSILEGIDKILRKHNIFAKSYYMMKEVIESEEKKCRDENESMPEIQMKFNIKLDADKHRYNPQRTNEVAAIFSTTADGEIPESYVTIKNKNDGELQYVTSMNPHIEPWIYPLFYPLGTGGYDSTEMRLDGRKRISRSAYVKNLIAIRDIIISVFF